MNKGHCLFWASYFYGVSLSGVWGKVPNKVETILPGPAPTIAATKGGETQESQAKSVLESPKIATDSKATGENQVAADSKGNKVAADEPIACIKLSGLQDLFANQKFLELFGLNNALVNIFLQSVLPPIGKDCSALKKNSNVGIFTLPNPEGTAEPYFTEGTAEPYFTEGTAGKGSLFQFIVFQEEGSAFEEWLKKQQIPFRKEGKWIIVSLRGASWQEISEQGEILKSFGKDFPKKLVALAEQPSQSGDIEVSVKPQYLAQYLAERYEKQFSSKDFWDFVEIFNGFEELKVSAEFPQDASQIKFSVVKKFNPAYLNLGKNQCKKSSIGENIDQKDAVAVMLAQNMPVWIDIVKFFANNTVRFFEKTVNPVYSKVVMLSVELVDKAVASGIVPEICSISFVPWEGKCVISSISKGLGYDTPEGYLEAYKSFCTFFNDGFQKVLDKEGIKVVFAADGDTSAGTSEAFVGWKHKFLEDYNGFKIFTYTMDCGDFNFNFNSSTPSLPDSAKQDASTAEPNGAVIASKDERRDEETTPSTKQNTSSAEPNGTVIASKDGRREEETTPSTKQNTSSTEPKGTVIVSKDGRRDEETCYVTFCKGEVVESDSLSHLRSIIDGIVAKELLAVATKSGVGGSSAADSAAQKSPTVTVESCIGGFTAETMLKIRLDLGEYLPYLPQQLSEVLDEEERKTLKESGSLEEIEVLVVNLSEFLSKEKAQGIISGELSVKDNQLIWNLSVEYATISALMAAFGAAKKGKSRANVAPKGTTPRKSGKAKKTSTPPAPVKTAFNFRLSDVIFGDRQILIPVKILTEGLTKGKAMG
ncbi:MAG: hypothetical protein LBG09_03360 [Puniceicoccales bacterium]|jgi:hypothetical protein|nr:hypothetical protein [Puniceicoccales bacterium]